MNKNKWDVAVRDAKARISALQRTIEYFREMKRKKTPWPTDAGGFLCSGGGSYAEGGFLCKAIVIRGLYLVSKLSKSGSPVWAGVRFSV